MTISFNSFNKEYLKHYLIGPTSHLVRLNLSTALGLKSCPIQRQDMKDLYLRDIRAPITMNTYVRMSP